MNKIAIMMRVSLVSESINNEGSIGNVVQPRQITIGEEIRQAISGGMLKHMHTRKLRLIADEEELCEDCKLFKPAKSSKVKDENKKYSKSGNKVIKCLIDDIEGFMDVKDGNCKRKSCIEFSDAIAISENEVENWIHSRVDISQEGDDQMIFHRPVRSNTYALTIVVDLDRIGYDDELLKDCISIEDKKDRQSKCITALKNMFLEMKGAMSSTKFPHLINIEGVLINKTNKNSILTTYSALNDDFVEVINKISVGNDIYNFNNVLEFNEVLNKFTNHN